VTRLLRLFFCAVLIFAPAAAMAAAPPFPAKTVTITARNQSVSNVVNDLFGQAGLRVKVSSAVNAKMNGTFTATPAEIWSQLSRAFNLVAYYDGAVVRVYAASEIQTRSFATASPAQVVRDAQRMQIADNANIIAASTGSVSATGVPTFLDRVEKLAGAVRAAAVSAPPPVTATTSPVVRNTTPASASIISPVLDGPATLQTVRSQVMAQASARNPYEVRIFYLRYARADDTIQKSSDRTDVTPGVGSILRGVMGDGRRSETVSTSGNFDIARQSLPRLLGRGLDSVAPNAAQQDYDDGPVAGSSAPQSRAVSIRDVNGPRVEVDSTNNAVIVRDRPEAMSVYEDIIRALDVEPRGIEVEATILELDITRLKELGIDFSLQNGDLNALFGGQQTNPTRSFSQGNIGANILTGALAGFSVRINALEKSGALRVVSRPRMSTLNNIPVVFNNQVTYYARVAGDRQVDLFPITAGLIMRVNPSVLYDGGELRTRLAIDIVDGSPSGLIVDGIPAVKQSSINTNAVVKQGESLMIGGMTIDTEYDYRSKVPVAGDIPVVGQLFRKRSKGGSHFERLFLITARILSQGKNVTPTSAQQQPRVIPLEQLQAIGAGRRYKEGGSR
jgi:type III secretion protein C